MKLACRTYQGISVCQGGHSDRSGRYGCDQFGHQDSLPRGRQAVPHNRIPRGTSHPPRHRGSVGSRRFGNTSEILRIHRFQHQRKAYQQRVHCHDQRSNSPPEKTETRIKKQAGGYFNIPCLLLCTLRLSLYDAFRRQKAFVPFTFCVDGI